ncbi:MAG: hypothetical protein Q3M30_11740 [Candidatus Electrothrix sp. Rat3]|nr:hypothetical protein [Candidatus Electrothrix rattekaaiensis]
MRINLLKTHSPQTVKHVLVLLKRIINFGYGQGWIAPLSFRITIPRVDNIKTEDLTPEQMQSLFDVLATTHPHHRGPYDEVGSFYRAAG